MSECESLNKKLLIACKEGDNQLIHSLLAKGASPDEGLKGACESNRKDLAIFMLSRGANPSYGLEGACKGGHANLTAMMIQMGATKVYRLFQKDIRFIVQVLFFLKGKPFHRLGSLIKRICYMVSDRLYLSNRHILPPLVVDLNTFKCERNIVRQFACDDVATFTARFAANSSVKESEVIKKRKLTFAS